MINIFDGKDMHTIKSKRPRDILNEIKWKELDLNLCTISYIHRGVPGDIKIIKGSSLKTISRSFFETLDGTSIPYHRILRIDHNGKMVYEKINQPIEGSSNEGSSHGVHRSY